MNQSKKRTQVCIYASELASFVGRHIFVPQHTTILTILSRMGYVDYQSEQQKNELGT